MSDQDLRIDFIALFSMIILLIVHLAVVSLLPDTIPKHLSLDGVVTGEVSRFDWTRFIFPVLGVAVVSLLTFSKYRYCKDGREAYRGRFTIISASFAAIMLIGWTYTMVMTIKYSGVNLKVFENLLFIPGTLSILMVISGSIMLFIGPNMFVGFRTEKTLANEDLWRSTNRFTGVAFIIVGAVIFLSSLYIDDSTTRKILSLSLALVCVALSAIVYRLNQRGLDISKDV